MQVRTRRPSALEAGVVAAALSLEDVSFTYQRGAVDVPVLGGASLSVAPNEVVAVVGRSGSGKSTLLHVAGGLAPPASGRVVLAGEDLAFVDSRRRAEIRRRHVGFVFQAFHVLPGLTVGENVALPLVLDGVRRGAAARLAAPVIEAVELADRVDHRPAELSGGEIQRVAIARALVADPAVVLADEPTGNLDSTTAEAVLDLLFSRVSATETSMVLVTHDDAVSARADRTLTMADGALRARRPTRPGVGGLA